MALWLEDRGEWDDNEINGSIELRDGSLVFATMDDGVHLVRPDGSALGFQSPDGSDPKLGARAI